jgi:hypothetical protein
MFEYIGGESIATTAEDDIIAEARNEANVPSMNEPTGDEPTIGDELMLRK